MPGDVRLFRRAVLADEVASRRLGIGDRFLNRPATGGVTGLDERIALAGENVNERVELVFVRSRTVAVAVAIYDQTTIPFFGDVDTQLQPVHSRLYPPRVRGHPLRQGPRRPPPKRKWCAERAVPPRPH